MSSTLTFSRDIFRFPYSPKRDTNMFFYWEGVVTILAFLRNEVILFNVGYCDQFSENKVYKDVVASVLESIQRWSVISPRPLITFD